MTLLKRWITALIIAGTATFAKAETNAECKHHPIYCKIIKYKKSADRNWAMMFSNKLVLKSKENGIDPNVALAILLQESRLENVNTFKTSTDVTKQCDGKNCFKVTTITEKAFDISIAQINVNTAVDYGFDIERLFLFDEAYALDCFFQVLKDKIALCSGKEKPWACYHSANDGPRMIYIDLVSRFL